MQSALAWPSACPSATNSSKCVCTRARVSKQLQTQHVPTNWLVAIESVYVVDESQKMHAVHRFPYDDGLRMSGTTVDAATADGAVDILCGTAWTAESPEQHLLFVRRQWVLCVRALELVSDLQRICSGLLCAGRARPTRNRHISSQSTSLFLCAKRVACFLTFTVLAKFSWKSHSVSENYRKNSFLK